MSNKEPKVFCPIRNCGCDDLSCDGVLPVSTHEDCREYEDGETRLRLVCLKGDAPYELPAAYLQEELDQLIVEYEKSQPVATPKRHYKTRKNITIEQAAQITGFDESTIKRLDKDPKNTKYPGRDAPVEYLAKWAKCYRDGKRMARSIKAANRPRLGAARS